LGIILSKTSNIYKVKLMKLLWYIDYISYKRLKKAVTGLVYMHQQFGALPIAYDQIIYLPSLNVEPEFYTDGNMGYNIILSPEFRKKEISQEIEKIIDEVINKFNKFNAKDIIAYMHKEDAYKKTKDNEIISFIDEFKLNEF
jgi:hypothetical protein